MLRPFTAVLVLFFVSPAIPSRLVARCEKSEKVFLSQTCRVMLKVVRGRSLDLQSDPHCFPTSSSSLPAGKFGIVACSELSNNSLTGNAEVFCSQKGILHWDYEDCRPTEPPKAIPYDLEFVGSDSSPCYECQVAKREAIKFQKNLAALGGAIMTAGTSGPVVLALGTQASNALLLLGFLVKNYPVETVESDTVLLTDNFRFVHRHLDQIEEKVDRIKDIIELVLFKNVVKNYRAHSRELRDRLSEGNSSVAVTKLCNAASSEKFIYDMYEEFAASKKCSICEKYAKDNNWSLVAFQRFSSTLTFLLLEAQALAMECTVYNGHEIPVSAKARVGDILHVLSRETERVHRDRYLEQMPIDAVHALRESGGDNKKLADSLYEIVSKRYAYNGVEFNVVVFQLGMSIGGFKRRSDAFSHCGLDCATDVSHGGYFNENVGGSGKAVFISWTKTKATRKSSDLKCPGKLFGDSCVYLLSHLAMNWNLNNCAIAMVVKSHKVTGKASYRYYNTKMLRVIGARYFVTGGH